MVSFIVTGIILLVLTKVMPNGIRVDAEDEEQGLDLIAALRDRIRLRPSLTREGSTSVKLIVGIIKPFKLDDVKDAAEGPGGPRDSPCRTCRGSAASVVTPRCTAGAEYTIDFVPKVRIEILVDDADTERVVQALIETARTGKIGDGKVWVVPVESVYRIRTGEAGPDAV